LDIGRVLVSERRWVIVLRGVELPPGASPAQLQLAVVRARVALGLPCESTVTVEEWLFDEATGGEFRRQREAA
jgi:hypothetical protein